MANDVTASSPIFIHSLFRAGSTWLFDRFRRSEAGYYCYQEPFHEILSGLPEKRDNILSLGANLHASLRHPNLDRPYFYEIIAIYDATHFEFSNCIGFKSFFDVTNCPGFDEYLHTLIINAHGRPLLQCCRSFGLISHIKDNHGGIHIHLWRNPWDQWWSYQVNDYFNITNLAIIYAKTVPEVMRLVRTELNLPEQSTLTCDFSRLRRIPLSASDNYFLFYSIWLYSYIINSTTSDCDINIDLLSYDKDYLATKQTQINDIGVNGISLSECRIPQSVYDADDQIFFTEAEQRARRVFAMAGYDVELLASIARVQREMRETKEDITSRGVGHARNIALRYINQEAAALSSAQEAEAKTIAVQQEAESRLSAMEESLRTMTNQYNDIILSTSWRATLPLRIIGKNTPLGIRRIVRRSIRLAYWTITLKLRSKLLERSLCAPRNDGLSNIGDAILKKSDAFLEATKDDLSVSLFTSDEQTSIKRNQYKIDLPLSNKPHVLFIDSCWPRHNRDAGSLYALAQVRCLQKFGYEVLFSADAEYNERNNYLNMLEAEGVTCVSIENYQSLDEFIRTFGKYLDLVFLTRVYSGGRHLEAVKKGAPKARVVFNTIDLHHIREKRMAQVSQDVIASHNSDATRAREIYITRQSDATIVVSGVEKDILNAQVPGAAVFEMPLIVTTRKSIPDFEARRGVGFVGGFEHVPNVDAIRYLLEDVWPHVVKKIPDITLQIVGFGLPDEIIMNAPCGVSYLGPLDNIEQWFDSLRLTVAPLRYGAGAKGKVASSLASGVPCVGTKIAAEGMNLVSGLHIEVGETPEDFARKIVYVHEDRKLWNNLSSNGRAKAEECFSIQSGEGRLMNLISSLPML